MKGASTITDRRAASTRQQANCISRIRLPADDAATARALGFTLQFAEQAGLGERVVDRLAIVVEEWVLNVVEHGRAPPDGRIGLRLELRTDHIRLTFSDPGVAFDPGRIEFAGPNRERGGGAGLALLRAWTRTARYERRAGRNRLVLLLPLDEG